jgi:hypothetical protein
VSATALADVPADSSRTIIGRAGRKWVSIERIALLRFIEKAIDDGPSGIIIEHWDLLQVLPDSPKHSNSMF